ncbi:MAG TPA: serine/threonine-protein kinase [Polyangiaceae bacterium]|nr:serine/threonine-protein kinase [Polyangiaceae bacterium]
MTHPSASRRDSAPASAASSSADRRQSFDTQTREEMRALLQERLGSFGLMFAIIFGIFFVWRLASALAGDDSPSQAFLPWQALSVATFSALWLVCRGRLRSDAFLHTIEFGCLCVAGGAATMMCLTVSYAARPDVILLLCMTYVLIARAIMVPSGARRTFVYGLVFAAPFLVSVFYIHRVNHNPATYTALADPRLRLDAATLAGRWTVIAGLWWIAALIIQTATSKVIYGLRQEVRDARRLGQYTLTEKLGQGGMGAVYGARHALLRRPCAIKLLPPDKFGPESAARFEREVQLTAELTHPNTIRVFDYGRTPEGVFYYVMEHLEGAALDRIVAQGGPMPGGRVIHVLDQVAGALVEAHGVGLIHRDIKPANIFLTWQGGVPDVAKVLDFGLVKQLNQAELDGTAHQPLTQDNSVTGTPQYMAPEAITAPESVDGRADLYALGAVGYFLLTGEHVFTGGSLIEILSQHLHTRPVPPSERLGGPVAEDLQQLILACLEKSPAQRPASARELQRALQSCVDARTWKENDAYDWFETHGEALRARRSHTTLDGSQTIAVDLDERAAFRSQQRA